MKIPELAGLDNLKGRDSDRLTTAMTQLDMSEGLSLGAGRRGSDFGTTRNGGRESGHASGSTMYVTATGKSMGRKIVEIMREIKGKSNLDILLLEFDEANKYAAIVLAEVNRAVQSLCIGFPRFFFLSNNELMACIADQTNEWAGNK